MARTLSSSNNLSRASAVISAVPLTMACWFRGALQTSALVSINNGGTTQRFSTSTAVGGTLSATQTPGAAATTVALYSAGVWAHACGVFSAIASRSIYLNGAGKVTETTTGTPAGMNRTAIGSNGTASANPWAGDMAEVTIWNVALTDAEVAALAGGASPRMIKPNNIVAYWPIFGDRSPEPDVIGAFPLTLTGSPWAASPPPPFSAGWSAAGYRARLSFV